ncbi:MAG: UDP-N-acetylmuramyl-tripeptide synthetase [Candidatus Pacebacteria bacterium GW2011_GWB1_47_8]|nr:MAG: UDP-N-acetylmuramyl-tripeptide synthetase [Candidatus Pacebacteria bacterium GW2011_GWA1_46_10]KKU84543.1 MAG: UDP-N-acetylmuramyl-tripeptide synthetase [Candidatus Pacebacteria bacterium GW2011_GWB1_47_8]HCR81676.1 UDP-N-acetylmuramoyl-L-alanyl-D-glutamate--2,6-diaminopimelate ligase [Candidatus Paceibacterota bacterium]
MKTLLYHLKYWYHFFKTGLLKGLPAAIRYGFPTRKLKIIAITGTDGKTTSSTLMYEVLKAAGKKAALLSTVAAYIGTEQIETGFHVTSPDAHDLQKLMAKMVKQKIKYLVLEFTSHGAYQHRLWGIKPLIAGVTNVTHEHLDYHLTYENYVEAKAMILERAKIVVLNEDDQSFHRLKKYLTDHNRVVTYSVETPLPKKIRDAVEPKFPELYNQMNARLVTKIATQLGINHQTIAQGIWNFQGVPGRMEFVPNKRGLKIVIDFAHTPNALEEALKALRRHMKTNHLTGRLIAVYGAAGLRDLTKRPLMGKVGVQYADLVVFTAEDPRTEDVWSIIRQMKEQLVVGHNQVVSLGDREQAIHFAINHLARRGDLVAFFGKGPEKSMCYGTTEFPWSERAVVEQALAQKK